jgi:hypothetical protein
MAGGVKRHLRIGDVVCIREESVKHLRITESAKAMPHVECSIEDVHYVGTRRCFHLKAPWQADQVFAWPSEVRLADGAEERIHAAKVKLHAELEAEREASRAARARCCPKKKPKGK